MEHGSNMAECIGDFRTLEIEWCTVHDCAEQSCTIRQLEAQLVSLIQGLTKVEAWLDGVRNETDRTRFEQRWNTLQDEAAELRVLILRALA